MPEAFVVHVVLHLPEYGFGLYAPSPSVLDTLPRGESFGSLPPVVNKPVVDLDCPVALALEYASFFYAPLSLRCCEASA